MAENRTNEFMALARSLPRDNGALRPQHLTPPTSGSGAAKNASSIAKLKDFHDTAGGISRDIAATSGMLAELTQLVRQKSLFQDDSQQVNELVVRIKTAIENLNGRLDEAGRQTAQQKRALGKNSQTAQAASNVVGQLQEEFGQAAAGFKTILKQRTDVMKETTDRKRDIYGTGGAAAGEMEDIPVLNLENRPPVYHQQDNNGGGGGFGGVGGAGFPTLDLTSGMMAAGEATGSQLPRPHGATPIRNSTGGAYSSYPGSSASNYYGGASQQPQNNLLSPFDIQRMEQESGQGQTMQLIPDQSYLRDRADAMEQVESNIVELGAVYNRLATMVHEHKDMVQRVEDNVDDANSMINLGLNTLTDTLTNLQSNRGLALKVFSILVVFIISFIIFFA
eukprot:CAMPEP_0201123270 /NCGR_PEP_ID=MMETSP0850-20130426/6684_1 /ASSEMBLY_ACC=CAM_ASM_000622 /TAXON_ID=183588 /ORGANISM="Pseudo-nitzschia fraudulenta, Strain WWA7" /LENGTH=392 /DNA_ID=CAMNT_0047390139 /DNA_START=41 /DNA_END=1219 /DNA_ORIENTATION=+